ncbi:uncharacterized protein EI90DRAFT_2918244 [Cantharellus anzutake]|uniref:uncharacterized protein n=1 Tax=Cantharellus anzutake TaxID=1750568 RepID=UPI001903171F|nr:uncharacterized protein EI90DRAFT_2918244 [Cantharellus anzutake]KAF8332768.1 hypothetical protein EI90DRAFT_2918244 [Cantharellus anzutake]
MPKPAKRKQSSNASRLDSRTPSAGPEGPRKKSKSTVLSEETTTEKQADPSSESPSSTSEGPALVCASMTCTGGRLGGAYFNPETSILYLLEDTMDSFHFDVARMFLEQAKPDIVIAPSRADERFLSACRDYMEEHGGTFQVRPHREFVPEKGRDKMLCLNLFSHASYDNSETSDSSTSRNAYDFMKKRAVQIDPTVQQRLARVRSANYSYDIAPLCFSSAGALLDHLCRAKIAGDLHNEGISSLDIRSIEPLAMSEVMQINSDALSSLQIFEDEDHASVHSDRSKEGLSLFGILNFTKTSLGKSLLKQWCLRPLLSISTITKRHDAVECFIRGENLNISDTIHTHLKGLKNAPRCIGIIKAGKGNASDWQAIVKAVFHFSIMAEVVSDLSNSKHVAILQKASFPSASSTSTEPSRQLTASVDVVNLREMGALINETIDWEASENERRICVRQHIDPELDEFKRIYHGLDSLLSKVALQVRETVPYGWASSLNVLYFPQLGYLISVPLRDQWKHQSDFEVVEGWKHQVCAESVGGFQAQQCLHWMISCSEIEIIHQLQNNVLPYLKNLLLTCELCAELDCLLSFATASRLYDYCRPEIVHENVIDIRKGRHPLVEQLSDLFVPNDLYLVGGREISAENPEAEVVEEASSALQHPEHRSVMICTGANACGKSVYLKQVLIFCISLHVFVPAESARLGVIDKIFTRLQTTESVSKIQSAFMIDLNQVSLALRNATARSLVLLDEFGKGTLSTDGAGLFCGVIQHLLQSFNDQNIRSDGTPKVLAATHFHEVFTTGLIDMSLPIRFVHMEAMLTSGGSEISQVLGSTAHGQAFDDDGNNVNIHYLYRVAEGLSMTSSHATKCALLYGIPRRTVARAEYVSDIVSHHHIDALLDEEMTETEKIDLEHAEEVCRAFLEWDLENGDEDQIHVKEELKQILEVWMS